MPEEGGSERRGREAIAPPIPETRGRTAKYAVAASKMKNASSHRMFGSLLAIRFY
jgi:hypothetical protein